MSIRRTRIVTGLVLFTYLTTHLLNHSLNAQASDGYAQPAYLAGQERTIAVVVEGDTRGQT